MVRATTTTVLLLLLQAAAYHQASVPTHANTVLTDAALSLKESLALDYDVLPMFKDITFMMESLVDLMRSWSLGKRSNRDQLTLL